MPTFTYTNDEPPRFELLPPGDYAFEIIDCDQGMGSKKTASCAVLSPKLKFFKSARRCRG